jgi:glutamine amidotransferase
VQHIAVVDVGTGNLRSVERALERAGAEARIECRIEITGSPEAIGRADKVVMPGQGAFRDCAAGLATGIGDALKDQIGRGTPYLGICLGLQALLEDSEEAPGAKGLGLFRGTVRRLADGAVDPATGAPVKIPHMGWNRIDIVRRGAGPLRVFDDDPPHVYFVHSFHAVPEDASLIAATADHGPYRITAAIQKDNVTATQFHPEKSQAAGLKLLVAFLKD